MSHLGHADTDIFHLAHDPFTLDDIAVFKREAPQEQYSGKKVFKNVLEGKSDCNGYDTHRTQGFRGCQAREHYHGRQQDSQSPNTHNSKAIEQFFQG